MTIRSVEQNSKILRKPIDLGEVARIEQNTILQLSFACNILTSSLKLVEFKNIA